MIFADEVREAVEQELEVEKFEKQPILWVWNFRDGRPSYDPILWNGNIECPKRN